MSDVLNWQEQREAWNKDGLCAREACKSKFRRRSFEHPTTNLLYCASCSRLLSEAQSITLTPVSYWPDEITEHTYGRALEEVRYWFNLDHLTRRQHLAFDALAEKVNNYEQMLRDADAANIRR